MREERVTKRNKKLMILIEVVVDLDHNLLIYPTERIHIGVHFNFLKEKIHQMRLIMTVKNQIYSILSHLKSNTQKIRLNNMILREFLKILSI